MYYKYKVTYYNSYTDEEQLDEGLVYANSYSSAANNIVQDYGKDEVIDMYLYEIYNEGEGTCLNKEEIDYAFKHD